MCRDKSGMAECLKDFSHTWSSTAHGEEGLYTILTPGGGALHWIDGLWLGCLALCTLNDSRKETISSQHQAIQLLNGLNYCSSEEIEFIFPNKSVSLQ